jgi:hypothetical protein
MLFGVTVTVILYFVNIFDAISEKKLILNISPASVHIHSKDLYEHGCCKSAILEKIFPVNHAQTYACLFSIERKL